MNEQTFQECIEYIELYDQFTGNLGDAALYTTLTKKWNNGGRVYGIVEWGGMVDYVRDIYETYIKQQPITHLTLTGSMAGVPLCLVNKTLARGRGENFAHWQSINPELPHICPDCKAVLDST